jgi:HlyD family secretion protein
VSEPPRRRFRRRAALGVGLAVVAALVAGGLWRANRPPPAVVTLVEPLEVGPFVREVTGSGVVEAVQERALAFTGGGTVADVMVSEGAQVAAGQTLARLDSATLEREAASVRSSLASARAERERLGAQQGVDRLNLEAAVAQAGDQRAGAARTLDDAERDLDVAQRLFDAGAASRDQVRAAEGAADAAGRTLAQADLALATARSRLGNLDQLAAAQRAASAAQVAQLETQLANLEARLSDTTIVAPFAGVVTAVGLKSGDLVGTQPVLTLADTSLLRVRGRFDENRAVELEIGQRASIVPDADARRQLLARVERISPVALREGGSAQVTVDLAFDPDIALDSNLARPGYTVTVRVRVRELEEALLMPLEAITDRAGETFVFRIDRGAGDTGVARRLPVTVAERNPTVAAVTGDLREGDLIAVINLDALADGAAVTFPGVNVGGAADAD